jgi:hypothetical protein
MRLAVPDHCGRGVAGHGPLSTMHRSLFTFHCSLQSSARGESRTRTGLPPADFELTPHSGPQPTRRYNRLSGQAIPAEGFRLVLP